MITHIAVDYCMPSNTDRIPPNRYNTSVTVHTDAGDRYILLCYTQRQNRTQSQNLGYNINTARVIIRRRARHWFWPIDSVRVTDGSIQCPVDILQAAIQAITDHLNAHDVTYF